MVAKNGKNGKKVIMDAAKHGYMFKVEKGVPLPPAANHRRNVKYPWELLQEVGDSFAVSPEEIGKDSPEALLKTLRSAIQSRKISSKKAGAPENYRAYFDEKKPSHVRVWRIEPTL